MDTKERETTAFDSEDEIEFYESMFQRWPDDWPEQWREMFVDFSKWTYDLDVPAKKYMLTYQLRPYSNDKCAGSDPTLWLRLFSHTTEYSIVVAPRSNYMGCTCQSRKRRAGETWLRGSDLPDGRITQETWDRIIKAILRYELVEVQHRVGDVAFAEQPMEAADAG